MDGQVKDTEFIVAFCLTCKDKEAVDIIWQLLNETGRLDEFFLEEKEEEEK